MDRDGELIANYRKMIMFPVVDNRYFSPGSDHCVLTLTNLEGKQFKAGIGICMDLDIGEGQDQWDFPLANNCRDNEVDCLIFPTAWDHYPEKCKGMTSMEIAMETFEYWLSRLTPMIDEKLKVEKHIYPRYSKEWLFLAADRVGQEMGLDYKGCSTAIVFNRPSDKNDHFEIEAMLDHKEEGSILVRSKLKR